MSSDQTKDQSKAWKDAEIAAVVLAAALLIGGAGYLLYRRS